MTEVPKPNEIICITLQHEEIARALFLKRWEVIEPDSFERLWTRYAVDEDSWLILEVHKSILQGQNRFPSDIDMYTFADKLLKEQDPEVRTKMIADFIAKPDIPPTSPSTSAETKPKPRRSRTNSPTTS